MDQQPFNPMDGFEGLKLPIKTSLFFAASALGVLFGRVVFDEITPPKTNMDTQNDGLEEVTPFKHGNSWYLC